MGRLIDFLISYAMKLNKLAFLLVIIAAATTHGQEFKFTEVELRGSCPKINYINNLDMPKLMGWWYRAFSTLDNHNCYNNEGQTMYAAQYNDKTLNVDICCRSAVDSKIAACGSNIGSGTVTATSNPGEFTYAFDNNVITIYVLDTDYDRFAIVYGCKTGSGRRSRREELIFVLTRDYTLTDSLEDRVRNVLQRNGSALSNAKRVSQGSSTPYTPVPRPCRNPPWHRNS